jgi:uncharacterized protein YjbJ (UPF0337 family)
VNDATLSHHCVIPVTAGTATFTSRHYFITLQAHHMNTSVVKGIWSQQKSKLKQQYAILTDNDLMFASGKKDEMLARLQIKLGQTKEAFEKMMAEL